MDSEAEPLAAANEASDLNASVEAIRSASESFPSKSRHSSSSPSQAPSTKDKTISELDWKQAFVMDHILEDNGIEYDAQSESENVIAIDRLLKIMSTDNIDAPEAVPASELEVFNRAARPGSLLPPPLAMPKRPSTINKKKDDLNNDMSRLFNFKAAAAAEPLTGSQSASQYINNTDSSSNKPKDKFDPAVSYKEYMKISEKEPRPMNLKSKSRVPASDAKKEQRTISSSKLGDLKSKAKPDGALHHAFKPGAQDCFLPAFQDPVYDAEFAAFKAAGKGVERQFQALSKKFPSPNTTKTDKPSTGSFSEGQTDKSSSDPKVADNFVRAGLIYVAHIQQQEEGKPHSYTDAEIQWAQAIVSEDVKLWMQQNSKSMRAKKSTLADSNQAFNAAPESEAVLDHIFDPRSPNPGTQFSKPAPDEADKWAEFDKMMSLPELDAEWEAFEKEKSAPKVQDGLQVSGDAKRRRPNPKAVDMHAEQEKPVTGDKKGQKKNN